MEIKILFFVSSAALFSVDVYLICSVWFRGKRSSYLKLFFAMGLIHSFWALLNGINVLLSEELYALFYPYVMIMTCAMPAVMLRYMLYFTESKLVKSRVLLWISIIFPTVDIAVLLTNPWHHEFISGYNGIYPLGGRWFPVHAVIAYIPLLITIFVFVRYIIKNIRKTPSIIYIAVGFFTPLVLNILYTFDVFNYGVDFTPFAFLAMFITFALHSIKFRLFDIKEAAFTSLFASSSDAILIIDGSGFAVEANSAFRNDFPKIKFYADKTTVADVTAYIKSLTKKLSNSDLYKILNSPFEEIHNAEITIMHEHEEEDKSNENKKDENHGNYENNEKELYYVVSKDIIHKRGQYAGYIITLTNVSDYHRIQHMVDEINEKNKNLSELKDAAESSSRAKSDFLARMSHEIRTPMNAIMGMSELLLRKNLEYDAYENATEIRNASSNLLSIINDILDFSKIESGTLEIIKTDYLFPSLINDVESIIRVRLIEKPIMFTINIDCNIPASLIGDEVRIRQILLNLLGNAVKYTSEGFIALNISGVIEENEEEHRETNPDTIILTIDISDSGIGIKDNDIEKLFGNFMQLDTEKNKGIEGTGLGLAISQRLCHAMGGNITVKSEYGNGSTFTVTLPQQFENRKPFASVVNPAEKSVLIYDPRQIYSNSLAKSLESLGVAYKVADSIESLKENLHKFPFPYVFIASFLYDSVNTLLRKLDSPPKTVILSEMADAHISKDVRTLIMPAHALAIANVLNDIREAYNTRLTGASFKAPDARVLVVDDIMANLKVAEGLLAPYEMRVDICDSGKKSIEMAAENRYDMIFMDHMMPEMNGIEAAANIRAIDPENDYFQNIPIIALTANAILGVKEMFVQSGMNDFLAKPVETEKLNTILEKWMPKEKQQHIIVSENLEKPETNKNETEQTESDFINMLRTIPELSIDKALAVLGGAVSTYEHIVKLSVELLPENILRLNNLLENDNTLNLYAIEVHGIKGVLNNIGAYGLGKMALKAETLSKAGNIDVCREFHTDFISQLTHFSNTAVSVIEQTRKTSLEKGSIAELDGILFKIEEAAEYFDSALALEILSSVSNYTYNQELDTIIKNIIQAFERFDFDNVANYIELLKKNLSI